MVPKLRFPEFQGAMAWEKKPLSANLDYLQPTPYLVSDTSYSPAYKTPVLTAGKTFILGYTNEEHGIFRDGLPVIIFDDFTTASQFVDFPFKAKSSAMKILKAKNGSNIKFMYEALQVLSFEVGAHERHWISVFAPILVAVPLPPEQHKIADCLDSADALIAAQGRKVEALRAHKKGLMQQLFPQEGETQPRLRFQEFEGTGDWEIKPLSEVATYENGKAYEQDIVEDGKYVVVNSRFISTDGVVRKYTNADYLTANAGDVLMVLSDLPKGRALAKCYFVEADDRYAVNQRICRLKGKRLDPKFLFFILDRNSNLLAYDDGQTQTHLSKANVLDCPLSVPPSKAEQKRIAACLTSLDHLIAAETRKLDTLKTHKKGLMQQLFPQVGETDA